MKLVLGSQLGVFITRPWALQRGALYSREMQTPAQSANLIAAQKAMMAEPTFPEPFAIWGFLRAALDRLAESA